MSAPEENAQLLTRKTVYRGRRIRLDLDRIQLPGGAVHELEVVRHPGASCIVPFVSAEEVLLLRQYRHAAGGYLYEVPAGTLEADEHPDACAARELEEETGYRAGRLERLGAIRTTPGFSDETIHVYAAHDLVPGVQATEESEVLTVERMSFDEALAMIADGRLIDAKSICALGFALLQSRKP